jgi:hypothetical protein
MQRVLQLKELARAQQSNYQVTLTTFATQNQKQKAQGRRPELTTKFSVRHDDLFEIL